MADQTQVGTNWSDAELDAIIGDYFLMLAAELSGQPYVKSHHAKALMEAIGRTHRSVEFKHMNISAVLGELGMPTIRGYRPKRNYQNAIFDAVDRYVTAHPEVLDWGGVGVGLVHTASHVPEEAGLFGMHEASAMFVHEESFPPRRSPEDAKTFARPEPQTIVIDDSPPVPGAPRAPRPPGLERLVRKFDPVTRDFRNRQLGLAGESMLVDFERRRLEKLDRPDLARKVRWVSQEDGDGAGYDIHSFNARGEDRLLEVKTTRGPRTTPFFLTRNEVSLAEERPDSFRLCRLYEVAQAPRLFRVKPPLDSNLTLEPEAWRASVG
ncbi:hypothetical protein GCM10007420_09740 [Glycocaulis albus]|uniref:Protein NO VEIN C-terminal domain-containing protein n=1 Tax=Glycocaulis albus TaxID=1382801 RepID=A0ABQ1XKK4_9PROT|nr:DUF3883 domain-containing protein [Glycocaulis albus]GGG96167.1 hypothetical protein GCM10007420_09740 [Glycocaulis albus]